MKNETIINETNGKFSEKLRVGEDETTNDFGLIISGAQRTVGLVLSTRRSAE